MSRGVNETSVFSGSFSDTNEHFLPDTTAADTEGYDVRAKDSMLVKVVNNQDQDATVSIDGSTFEDAGMSEADEAVGSATVSANGGTETFVTSDPWSYLRAVVTFATAPTGSGSIKAVFQADETGG